MDLGIEKVLGWEGELEDMEVASPVPCRSGLRGCPSYIPKQPGQLISLKSVFQAAVEAVTDVGLCREQTQPLPVFSWQKQQTHKGRGSVVPFTGLRGGEGASVA